MAEFDLTAGFITGFVKTLAELHILMVIARKYLFAAFAYRSVVKKKALSIHRISNKLTALFCRLATRKTVRKVFAAACKTE